MAIASDYGFAVLELTSKQELLTTQDLRPVGMDTPCAISWRPGSNEVAIASNSSLGGTVWLLDTSKPENINIPSLVDYRYTGVLDLSWNSSGKYLAVANVDSTIRLWQPSLEYKLLHEDSAEPPVGNIADNLARAVDIVTQEARECPISRPMLKSGIRVVAYEEPEDADLIQQDHIITITPDRTSLITTEWADVQGASVRLPDAASDSDFQWVMSSTQACQDFGIASEVAVHTLGFPDIRLALRNLTSRQQAASFRWVRPRCLAVDPAKAYLVAVNEVGHITLFKTDTLDRICTIYIDEAAVQCIFDSAGERLVVVGFTGLYVFRLFKGQAGAKGREICVETT